MTRTPRRSCAASRSRAGSAASGAESRRRGAASALRRPQRIHRHRMRCWNYEPHLCCAHVHGVWRCGENVPSFSGEQARSACAAARQLRIRAALRAAGSSPGPRPTTVKLPAAQRGAAEQRSAGRRLTRMCVTRRADTAMAHHRAAAHKCAAHGPGRKRAAGWEMPPRQQAATRCVVSRPSYERSPSRALGHHLLQMLRAEGVSNVHR